MIEEDVKRSEMGGNSASGAKTGAFPLSMKRKSSRKQEQIEITTHAQNAQKHSKNTNGSKALDAML